MQPEVNENSMMENPQDGVPLTTDELAAAMGFMTTLGDQQMMAEQAMAPVDPQEAQEEGKVAEVEEETEEDKTGALEGKFDEKMETLQTELKSTIKTEIDAIRDDIKNALDNETE